MRLISTKLQKQTLKAGLRLALLLLLLSNPWSAYWAQAQTPTFTAAQLEQGTDCNWPFNAVATNPVDKKIYGFWRKGAGEGAVYKLIKWGSNSWSTLSTFTTSGEAARP